MIFFPSASSTHILSFSLETQFICSAHYSVHLSVLSCHLASAAFPSSSPKCCKSTCLTLFKSKWCNNEDRRCAYWIHTRIRLVVFAWYGSRSSFQSTTTSVSLYNKINPTIFLVFHLSCLFIIHYNAFELTPRKSIWSSWCHEVIVEGLRVFVVVSIFFTNSRRGFCM